MYYTYSDYLKNKYHEKVYKLPVNLPVTCPNRLNGACGCDFCAEQGTGFEALNPQLSVTEQLTLTREKIEKKYHAHKFIAYFQNYTNTFLPIDRFEKYMREGASFPDVVEISISTRPDCIRSDYLEILEKIRSEFQVEITLELGLQTVNYHTLRNIHRGHTLAEFIDAMWMIRNYHFDTCAHVILNLPGDDLMGSDVAHLQLAEVGEQLGADNMLLCGPSVFLEPGLHICCVKFHKTFEVHIQISAGFMNLFTLPCLCLSLGLEAPLLGLLAFAVPVGIAVDRPPGVGLFFLVDCHD